MDNKMTTSGIFFQNRLNQKRTSNKALCLNPACNAKRMFKLSINLDQTTHQDHEKCKGWIHSMEKLKKWQKVEDGMELGPELSTDYLENPIESIYYIQKFASIRWEDNLYSYFQQLKSSIDEELDKIYINCQKEINQHLQVNQKIFNNLQTLCEKESLKSEKDLEQFYKNYLENSLRQIQMTGILKICNNEVMEKNLEFFIGQLKTISDCIWNKELQYDLNKRILRKTQKEEMRAFSSDWNAQQTSKKIQMFQSQFKTLVKYVDEDKATKISCFVCPKTLLSTAINVKARKQECRNLLLNHMLSNHIQQIELKQSVGSSLKITLQELRKDIIFKQVKKVMVVDKQNVGHFKSEAMNNYTDYYFIEVVSMNSEHMAKSKYLLAESKGKDAADILTIIVLWELSRLKLDRLLLLTKDHYGETLKPIFASLGVDIAILSNHTAYNY